MRWQEILEEIKSGEVTIPTSKDGVPLVAVNAQYYELMELLGAMAEGYNALVQLRVDDQKKIDRIRQLAKAQFPADRQTASPGWVAVDDMLPPRSGQYMTYDVKCPHRGVYPLEFSAKHGKFNACDSQDVPIHAIEVTHWHPSPVPPVVERHDNEVGEV